MKIGVIYCGYNTIEYVEDSITPWLELKDKHNIYISAISSPFEEFPNEGVIEDGTTEYLKKLYDSKKIDYFFDELRFKKEHVLRSAALEPLLNNHLIDFIWLVDSDEIYSIEDIENTINFLKQNNTIPSYELYFKNYFHDSNTFYSVKFVRIFNNKINNGIKNFSWDCEIYYNNGLYCKSLNVEEVPENLTFIKHYSWLSNERSRLKIEYHQKHFGACSFIWNYNQNKIEINYPYYNITGYSKPILQKDNEN